MSNNLAEKFKQKIEQSEISKIPEAEVVSSPQVVQVMEVEVPAGDLEVIKNRHEESVKNYPNVKIDNDEYVVMSLRKSWIGLAGIVFAALFIFVALVSAWILICFMPTKLNLTENMKQNLSFIFVPMSVLVAIMGYIGYSTYKANRFVATNERAIQWIVTGLLDHKKQAIKLESVEDISFSQKGIFQHLFNFGTIRLSTTGDESTYTFTLVKNPAKVVEILGELAECARENQPVPEEIMASAQKISVK